MPSPLARVLSCLPDHRHHGDHYAAKCPVHQGTHRDSLSLREDQAGNVLLHCFGGCDPFTVIRALGLDWPDLFAVPLDRTTRPPRPTRAPYVPDLHPTGSTIYAANYLWAILADALPTFDRDERLGCYLGLCEDLGLCYAHHGHQAALDLWQSWLPELRHVAPALLAMMTKGIR